MYGGSDAVSVTKLVTVSADGRNVVVVGGTSLDVRLVGFAVVLRIYEVVEDSGMLLDVIRGVKVCLLGEW